MLNNKKNGHLWPMTSFSLFRWDKMVLVMGY